LETKDESWSSDRMRQWFEKLERCRNRPFSRWLGSASPTRHGWDGWLQTEKSIPREAIEDARLGRFGGMAALRAAARTGGVRRELKDFLHDWGDPSDWRRVAAADEGIFHTPLTTCNGARTGTRERLLAVAWDFPLAIELDAHATQVLFDGARAVG